MYELFEVIRHPLELLVLFICGYTLRAGNEIKGEVERAKKMHNIFVDTQVLMQATRDALKESSQNSIMQMELLKELAEREETR